MAEVVSGELVVIVLSPGESEALCEVLAAAVETMPPELRELCEVFNIEI